MESVESFEDYLYSKGAVFVDLCSEEALDLALLGVLVKCEPEEGERGLGGFLRWLRSVISDEADPVLVHWGSMEEVGTYLLEDDRQSLHDGLREFDRCTREKLAPPDDSKLFEWIPNPASVDKRQFRVGPGFKIALEKKGILQAGTDFANSRDLMVNIENWETLRVNKQRIISIVEGLRWKPTNSVKKLWVVHQILFASKVVVTSSASASAGANFTFNFIPGLPSGHIAKSSNPPSQKDLTWEVPSANSKYPGKIMFAFRPLCFEFNDVGECVKISKRMQCKASLRGESDDDDDDDRAHIHELFLNSTPGGDESDEETCLNLQPLRIKKLPAAPYVPVENV